MQPVIETVQGEEFGLERAGISGNFRELTSDEGVESKVGQVENFCFLLQIYGEIDVPFLSHKFSIPWPYLNQSSLVIGFVVLQTI